MKESHLWDMLKRALPDADLTRHEERGRRGVPDVSYGYKGVNGWIELKAYDRWPSDPQAPVPFRNFKPIQRRWLLRRHKSGGHCFVLVAIGTDVYLFDAVAAQQLGKINRRTFSELWVGYWNSKLTTRIAELLV